MPKEELDSLFADAGIAESAQRVMTAVSGMEGGFDSVNTYDTGYVSVGLIQFACLSKGAGSLSQVLLREKNEDAGAFQTDFRQYGISVSESGVLLAADLDGSTVSEGPAAARKIVEDKRLISVFKHAGQTSRAFRIAQLRVAKDMYYPAEDLVTVDIGGQSLTGKVGDFIRSEAGMATIMDRKVVTGKIDALGAALSRMGAECQCQSVDDLADHELEIMAAVRYRHDFAQDLELSQPGVGAARDGSLTSRHGGRTGRQGGRRSTGSK
jgi:hypothetical protein